MKKFITCILLSVFLQTPAYAYDTCKNIAQADIYFSPNGGTTDRIVSEISKATTSIKVSAYSFTSVPIIDALVEAHVRKVLVEIVLDDGQLTAPYSGFSLVVGKGIPTHLDKRHQIAHNKYMIIDGKLVVTGSFNFTKSAESGNAENTLIIKNKCVAEKYINDFETHRTHSLLRKLKEN